MMDAGERMQARVTAVDARFREIRIAVEWVRVQVTAPGQAQRSEGGLMSEQAAAPLALQASRD